MVFTMCFQFVTKDFSGRFFFGHVHELVLVNFVCLFVTFFVHLVCLVVSQTSIYLTVSVLIIGSLSIILFEHYSNQSFVLFCCFLFNFLLD
jgi:hypothetical protein